MFSVRLSYRVLILQWVRIQHSAEGITISSPTDLNDLIANNVYIMNNANCPNYPPNNFTLGKLLVQKSTYGIRQIFFNDNSNTTYTRNCYADINNWTNWSQIYPDYANILLNTNGYIVFMNGLILQWAAYSNLQVLPIYERCTIQYPISFSKPYAFPFISPTWNSGNGTISQETIDSTLIEWTYNYCIYSVSKPTNIVLFFIIGY